MTEIPTEDRREDCPICGGEMPPRKATGRPRLWCSDSCGTQARNRRRYGRSWEPRRDLEAELAAARAALAAEIESGKKAAREAWEEQAHLTKLLAAERERSLALRLDLDRLTQSSALPGSQQTALPRPVDGLSVPVGSTRPPASVEPPQGLSRAERRRLKRLVRRG